MSAPEDQNGRAIDPVDRLLDAVAEPTAPEGLAERVLAGTQAELERGERALDAVLDRLAVDAPRAGLTDRVLAATAAERESDAAPIIPAAPRPRWSRTAWIAPLAAAAAALAVLAPGWFATDDGQQGLPAQPLGAETVAQVDPPVDAPAEPESSDDLDVDPELLANLAVLEEWELLMGDELELLLADLEEVDEWLVLLPENG